LYVFKTVKMLYMFLVSEATFLFNR